MYKDTDFSVDLEAFHFRSDSYPLSKINNARIKRLNLLDNLGEITFWVFVFSGAVWFTVPNFGTELLWLKLLAISLSVVGFVFSLFRCAKYALQIEFKHIDETGIQWVDVAKSYSTLDNNLFEDQVRKLKKRLL